MDVPSFLKHGPAVQLLRPPQSPTAARRSPALSTLGNRRPEEQLVIGQIRQVERSTLHMAQGGVLREDRILAEGAYLTEMLTDGERRSVWLPNSWSKNIWDLVLALLVSYTAIMLPIELCYDDVLQTQPERLIIFDVFVDVVFLFDIVRRLSHTASAAPAAITRPPPIRRQRATPRRLSAAPPLRPPRPHSLPPLRPRCAQVINFRVGYIDQAVVIVDKKAIRRKYLGRWFAIDVIGAFPGDSIFAIVQAATTTASAQVGEQDDGDGGFGRAQASILTLFKVLKIPKIMRLGRVLKTLEKLEGIASIANILILLVIIIFMNHWISCFFFLVSKGEGGTGHCHTIHSP